jgi:hypothetical protein
LREREKRRKMGEITEEIMSGTGNEREKEREGEREREREERLPKPWCDVKLQLNSLFDPKTNKRAA